MISIASGLSVAAAVGIWNSLALAAGARCSATMRLGRRRPSGMFAGVGTRSQHYFAALVAGRPEGHRAHAVTEPRGTATKKDANGQLANRKVAVGVQSASRRGGNVSVPIQRRVVVLTAPPPSTGGAGPAGPASHHRPGSVPGLPAS
jgi:hypothetical protein